MEMKFNEIPIPKELDQVVENSLNQIYAQKKKRRAKKIAAGFGAAVAGTKCPDRKWKNFQRTSFRRM